MKKIIFTVGLQGSGKTTWAKNFITERTIDYGEKWKRINKDTLREMFDNGQWSKGNENFILKVRDFTVLEALKEGYSVIIDDTNFGEKHQNHFKELLKIHNIHDVEIENKDFTHVPLEICIERDLIRPNSVGEKIIKKFYNQYLKPVPTEYFHDPALPNAILADLDGTLALFGNRNPYDRDFINDEVNMAVKTVLDAMHTQGFDNIFLVSGRKNKYFQETQQWLNQHKIFYDRLFMPRADNDNRKDVIIKSEIYEAEIKGKYNVYFILDDRTQVVEYWRSLGLTVFQVAEGDF